MRKLKCGVIGTGWMARAQMQAVLQLPKYNPELPEIEFTCVTSRSEENYQSFAQTFGFKRALPIEQFWNEEFDHLLIASPCHSHFEHLMRGLHLDHVKKIYCEKPLVASAEECRTLIQLSETRLSKIQLGFQFLQIPAIQKARELAPALGRPIHFQGHYLKSGYLDKEYRDSRRDRLLPAPVGGVTSDLASHVFSLLLSFLGDQLLVKGVLQGGSYSDVDSKSDLHIQILLKENKSNAVGTVTASRISTGNEDELGFSLHFENGALKFSTSELNTLRVFRKGGGWQEIQFPQHQTRSPALVEAFSLFFGLSKQDSSFMPKLDHGVHVQKLVNDTVSYL